MQGRCFSGTLYKDCLGCIFLQFLIFKESPVLCSREFVKALFKSAPFKRTLETLLQHYVE